MFEEELRLVQNVYVRTENYIAFNATEHFKGAEEDVSCKRIRVCF